jgi:hypothetical protein
MVILAMLREHRECLGFSLAKVEVALVLKAALCHTWSNHTAHPTTLWLLHSGSGGALGAPSGSNLTLGTRAAFRWIANPCASTSVRTKYGYSLTICQTPPMPSPVLSPFLLSPE